MESEQIQFEKPRTFNSKNVCYWETTSKELKIAKKQGDKQAGVFLTKAKMFLDRNCIKQIDLTTWICEPIKNYNNSTYKIRMTQKGFECNCHGFNSKLKDYENGNSDIQPICSHIIAVKQFCFIESKGEFKC